MVTKTVSKFRFQITRNKALSADHQTRTRTMFFQACQLLRERHTFPSMPRRSNKTHCDLNHRFIDACNTVRRFLMFCKCLSTTRSIYQKRRGMNGTSHGQNWKHVPVRPQFTRRKNGMIVGFYFSPDKYLGPHKCLAKKKGEFNDFQNLKKKNNK